MNEQENKDDRARNGLVDRMFLVDYGLPPIPPQRVVDNRTSVNWFKENIESQLRVELHTFLPNAEKSDPSERERHQP